MGTFEETSLEVQNVKNQTPFFSLTNLSGIFSFIVDQEAKNEFDFGCLSSHRYPFSGSWIKPRRKEGMVCRKTGCCYAQRIYTTRGNFSCDEREDLEQSRLEQILQREQRSTTQ